MRLTTEQADLRAAVRGLLDRYPAGPEPDPDAERAVWRRLCTEIGVAGLAIPERFGGSGAGPVEIYVVMAELGRSLTAAPMLGSAVLATEALLASGDEAACRRLLPQLADGSTTAALAWTTAAGHFDPAEVAFRAAPQRPPQSSAAEGEAPYLLNGEAQYVLDGEQATVLLAAAALGDGTVGLFEIDRNEPGLARCASTTVDDTRRLSVIRLTRAAGRPIGGEAALDQVLTAACLALSAEMAGAAAAALEQTVAYSKLRVQFGRPIGSFQALQHRMAEMHVLAESAASLSLAAAQAAQQGAPDARLRAAAAKAYCAEALQHVTAEMIQLHGAIGMTWEHLAHRYFKRSHSTAMLLGTPAAHRARIAGVIVDGG
jgi:alkylation response protein AidB-like acyl-CoA dehydrogenase